MNTQDFISIAIEAGCEIIEYEKHYCLRHSVKVVVTVPKVEILIPSLVERIKDILGL